MKPGRVVVLLNAGAGGIDESRQNELAESIDVAFARRSISATCEFLPGQDLKAGAVRACDNVRSGKIDAVVAAGGDGTVSTIASALSGSDIVLGVLPLGTLNHFAKDLGIPVELEEAVEVISTGHARSIDVAEVNGRVFINNSSIGVYPFLVLDRERRRRRHGLPKWAAMFLATLRAIRRFPVRRLTIMAQGQATPYSSACVFIGNNKYELSGMELGTRQQLDGGQLSLYVAKPRTPAGLARSAWQSFLKRPDELDKVLTAAVEINSPSRKLMVALDGEVELLSTPLSYKIMPSALRVFAPASVN